jgi:DNA-binding helix-hairpin-helix protein with protein kinase domain
MLSSYGIDDAADVTATAVEAVTGFGQFLTEEMMAWRRSLEFKPLRHPVLEANQNGDEGVDLEILPNGNELEILP